MAFRAMAAGALAPRPVPTARPALQQPCASDGRNSPNGGAAAMTAAKCAATIRRARATRRSRFIRRSKSSTDIMYLRHTPRRAPPAPSHAFACGICRAAAFHLVASGHAVGAPYSTPSPRFALAPPPPPSSAAPAGPRARRLAVRRARRRRGGVLSCCCGGDLSFPRAAPVQLAARAAKPVLQQQRHLGRRRARLRAPSARLLRALFPKHLSISGGRRHGKRAASNSTPWWTRWRSGCAHRRSPRRARRRSHKRFTHARARRFSLATARRRHKLISAFHENIGMSIIMSLYENVV